MLADRDLRSPLSLESLARANLGAGKTDEAMANYETLLARGNETIGWEAQLFWLNAHLPLAKLYIERKEPEKARRTLQEILTLWQDADPDLILNKEAQRLIKTL